jgi:hypothetical protein
VDQERTSIEGWAAKIGRDKYGRKYEIAIKIAKLYGHGLDLRAFGEGFYCGGGPLPNHMILGYSCVILQGPLFVREVPALSP